MNDLERIRRITIYFSFLQGLKVLPMGLLLAAVSLWANSRTGPRSDLLFPGGCLVTAFLLYEVIRRYYARTYGTVQPTAAQRRGEILRGVLGGIVGLAAFLADVNLKLPVSMIGLLFAASLPVENLWLSRQFGARLLEPAHIAFSVFLAALSLLPLVGVQWWQYLGIRGLLLGICIVAGFTFVPLGIWAHYRLTRWMPAPQEANHEQRI